MMDLFQHIKCVQTGKYEYSGEAEMNTEHVVLKAHFPGNPILPGVLILQIVHIMVSKAIGADVRLDKIGNVKFVRPIIPANNELLKIDFFCTPEEDGYMVNADIFYKNELMAQFKNLFYLNSI